jgi:hypothetical protein
MVTVHLGEAFISIIAQVKITSEQRCRAILRDIRHRYKDSLIPRFEWADIDPTLDVFLLEMEAFIQGEPYYIEYVREGDRLYTIEIMGCTEFAETVRYELDEDELSTTWCVYKGYYKGCLTITN